jgi:hypothetical protein
MMTLMRARVIVFSIWSILFLVYLGMFLAVAQYHPDIDPVEARGAAWRVAYILVPVLSAFASFWFVPQAAGSPQPETDGGVVRPDRAYAMFVLTGVVHSIVLFYFLISVVLHRYPLSPPPGEAFLDRVDWGLNLLLFLSSLAVLPVGWLLRDPTLNKLHDMPK